MPKAKPFTKEQIKAAMAKTKSVKAAARYLNCSYHHLKRYMKLYTDEETGKTTHKEVPFSEYYAATKSYENLNPNELQALSWTTKFKTGENAEQYQKQLVALPILQNTPNVRKGEIVQVLNKLYNNWQRQPDRPADESWLEFARSKNYWGLTPSQTPTSGFGGYQGMFS